MHALRNFTYLRGRSSVKFSAIFAKKRGISSISSGGSTAHSLDLTGKSINAKLSQLGPGVAQLAGLSLSDPVGSSITCPGGIYRLPRVN